MVFHRFQCAGMTNGCRSAITIDAPLGIDVYNLDRAVPEDKRVDDLLRMSDWWLDQGHWMCGNHQPPSNEATPTGRLDGAPRL